MTDRFRRCEQVFHDAVALDEEARARFLAEACADDPGLRKDVERLLAAHAHAGDFIASPALASAGVLPPEESWAGRRIGPYRVLREIGRGGMGAVYLAERADGQYEQRVALKLIKRGMDTEQVLARFRAERQILASLDHPNIARLLDGGSTNEGVPFFAMEYIEGEPIDVYVDGRELPVEDRIRLFLQVCGAVAYAHQRLVVHRDIKPLNILVTADGSPKLLDFGIAKVLHDGADEATSTVTGMRLLTPEYASPEQIEGQHATTSSDVYALGVVLYELLTGRSPYGLRGRSPIEVVAAVRTTDPDRPSVAGGTEKLRRRLRGDLDVILLMALRKEPARRYQSVEQFAGDLRRHLDGMPVRARPDTFRYRTGKFVRRHRSAVAAGVLVLLALIGGTVATAWQARQARAAQAQAERRFADVRRLANAVLFDYHDAIKDLRGARPVRERLVRDALGYLDTLAREAHGDPSLQRELAAAYKRWGDLQSSEAGGTGDYDGAVRSYTKAVDMLDALLRTDEANSQVRRDAASAQLALGKIVWERGDLTAALQHAERARGLLEPLMAGSPADAGLRLQLASAIDRLGEISLEAGDIAGSLAYHRAGLHWLETAPLEDRSGPAVRYQASVAYGHLGDAQSEAADLTGALESQRRSVALRAELTKEFPDNATYANELVTARYYQATTLTWMNRWSEALGLYRQSLAQDNSSTFLICRIGEALDHLGRHVEALDHFRRALTSHYRELRADTARLQTKLAVLEDQGRICKTLASLGRSDAAGACSQATRSAAGITVDSSYAFPRAFVAAAFTNVGDAYEIMAGRRSASRADRQGLLASALEVHRRSEAIWNDLSRRKLVSPVDTGRVSGAVRTVTRIARLVQTPERTERGATE